MSSMPFRLMFVVENGAVARQRRAATYNAERTIRVALAAREMIRFSRGRFICHGAGRFFTC